MSARLPVYAGEKSNALSPRELEIAALVARGLQDKEIGRQLHISAKTASNHVSSILAKAGLPSRAAIGAWLAEQVAG